MELSKSRYTVTLSVQIILIFCDLFFNTFFNNFSRNKGILLFIFLLQDFLQIFSFVLMLITFFQTNVFQAGFVMILYEKFWDGIVISFIYIILSIILHVWTLIIQWNEDYIYNWSLAFYCCFVIHRLTSITYYYVYKRTALRISDQRLYEDEWINHIIHHQNM